MKLEVKTYYNGELETLEPTFLYKKVRYQAHREKNKNWVLYTMDKNYKCRTVGEFKTTKELLDYIKKNMGSEISPYPFHISPPTH